MQAEEAEAPAEIEWDIEVPEAGAEAEADSAAEGGPSIDWDIEEADVDAGADSEAAAVSRQAHMGSPASLVS